MMHVAPALAAAAPPPPVSGRDPVYERAVDVVVGLREASVPLLQRNLRVRKRKAQQLIASLEDNGIIAAPAGALTWCVVAGPRRRSHVRLVAARG
jgi:DNA segregation ATPase FtsK/SpoIIIE-like protein